MVTLTRIDGISIDVEPALVEALEPAEPQYLPAGVTDATWLRFASPLDTFSVIGAPFPVSVLLGGPLVSLARIDGANVFVQPSAVESLDPVSAPYLPAGVPDATWIRFHGPTAFAVIGTVAQVAAHLVVVTADAARRDHSVNGALVDLYDTPTPLLRTKTDAHPAGGFTGGGVGNKAILGHVPKADMPLGALQMLEFVVEQLTRETGLVGNTIPYVNLIVELDPAGPHAGVYTIFSMMSREFPGLNLGAFVDTPPFYRVTWDAQLHFVQVVSDRGLYRTSLPLPVWDPPFPLAGPPGQFVAPAVGVGGDPPPGSWTSRSYQLGQILAFYPGARIAALALSGDGGMPKLTTTAGVLLVLGDSANVKQNAVRVTTWRLNGVSI